MDRRAWLKTITATGFGSLVFQRALAAQAQDANKITKEMIRNAQWVSGVELSDEEVEELEQSLERKQEAWEQLCELKIDPAEYPLVHFRPMIEFPKVDVREDSKLLEQVPGEDFHKTRPTDDETLAFCSVYNLSHLLKTRQVTSVELTQLYLNRLKTFDPLLKCVVNLTEDLAMKQARQADAEISSGNLRGLLHGIPWGAKDLMAVPGYPTTWGAPQFKDQQFDEAATVYQKLTAAGAVLVAKLSLGALAMGDQWFGGKTRNPWNAERGSSGSSAGSASAVAAGLVGFAIGTETLGSILSPSRECGTVGLRPTFGAVSRHGCMPLSWTMDKIGPITRSVPDARAVLEVIKGFDGKDPTVVDRQYSTFSRTPLDKLRVGYVASRRRNSDQPRKDLQVLEELGVRLVEVELPSQREAYPLTTVLEVEGASVFESWLNQKDTEGWNSWPRIFRSAQFVTAVDYLRAQRLRGRLVKQMEAVFDQVDILVNANDLVATNLTGHPSLSLPFEFSEREGSSLPRPCVLTGRYFDEGTLCELGMLMHEKAETLSRRPPLQTQLQSLLESESEDPDTESQESVEKDG